ncbi:MAG: HAD family hydrolase [Dehalococcoidia bacterium]
MSRLELVVFDLAGTLIDDGGAVLNAYRLALSGERLPFTEDELQAARGGNKRAVMQMMAERGLGAGADADAAAARAYACFDAALSDEYQNGPLAPMAGAEQALQLLRAAGLKLATNTGFPRSLARLALARLDWLEAPFDAHVAGDEVPDGRPAPYMIQLAMQRTGVHNAGRVLAIGDTPLDLRAGSNAGVAGVVGVLTGTHGVDTLGRVRHTHILPSVAALPDLIAAEFA